jgi:predicted nuclease of predicted toxin-antitoxin system
MKNLMHSKFLIELGKYLQWKGYTVLHSQNDADILIFKTILHFAKTQQTVLVGKDTDLLVLLLHYYN